MKVGGRINGTDSWTEVVEKVKRKIKKWEARKMSFGGRITLLKAVLSSIPIYNLSFLPLPKLVGNHLRKLLCNFLWGGDGVLKKVAWVKWEDVCQAMKVRGLGLRDFCALKKALLSKWIWRFISEKDRLWNRVITSRYGEFVWDRRGACSNPGRGLKIGWWRKVLAGVEGRDGCWFWEKFS